MTAHNAFGTRVTGPDTEAAELDALIDAALGGRPRPVNLAALTAAQCADHQRRLDDWVRWLVRRYSLDHRDIPPCWAEHGVLLEELSALYTAHQAAYGPAGSPAGPADWHHTLAATLSRLQLAVARTGCRPGQHRPPSVPSWIDDNR